MEKSKFQAFKQLFSNTKEEEAKSLITPDTEKRRFLQYATLDILDFSLRKVVYDAVPFCTDRCRKYDSFITDAATRENYSDMISREEEVCMENCLGKHSDSMEQVMPIMMKMLKERQEMQNKLQKDYPDGSFLLGAGVEEPYYAKVEKKTS